MERVKSKVDKTLRLHHNRAVELRYLGKSYEEIVKIIKEETGLEFKSRTVNYWFMRNGLCADAYIDYAKKENERRRQAMIQELGKTMQLIPDRFYKLMTRKDKKTGEELIDRTTLATCIKLCELLGLEVKPDGSGLSDPLDEYFDRLEQKEANEHEVANQPNQPTVPAGN